MPNPEALRVSELAADWRNRVRLIFGQGPTGIAMLKCAAELESALSEVGGEAEKIVRSHRRHVEQSPGVGADVQKYALAVLDDVLDDLSIATPAAQGGGEELCGCGKPGEYAMVGGGFACNKYMRCRERPAAPVTDGGGMMRKALERIKLRLHFDGWPGEPMWQPHEGGKWVPDWRYEIDLLEHALNGSPLTRAEKPDDTKRRDEVAALPAPGDAVRGLVTESDVEFACGMYDGQWVNIVNHDNCYRDYTKDEAVAQAVKLTYAALRENNLRRAATPPPDAAPAVSEALRALPGKLRASAERLMREWDFTTPTFAARAETYRSCADQLEAALSASPAGQDAAIAALSGGGWLPIESAPKDGTPILVMLSEPMLGSLMHVAVLHNNVSTVASIFAFDAPPMVSWQPLPAAPAQAGEGSNHG